MFDPRKLFDAAYRKSKLLTCFVCSVSIIFLVNIIWSSFYSNIVKINNTRANVAINSSEIGFIKKRLSAYDVIVRTVVTRPSFNAYIKRKDEEYHEQNELNNETYLKLGHLEGEVHIMSDFLQPSGLRHE